MAATDLSNGTLRRVIGKRPPVELRIVGFVVVIILGSLVLSWMTRTTWAQLDRLQREHAAVKTESFYLGVHLRGQIRSLNDKLLQFGLAHDPVVLKEFLDESSELKAWIDTNRNHLAEAANLQLLRTLEVSRQVALMRQAGLAYETYLTNAAEILATPKEGEYEPFEAVYQKVRDGSNELFPLCEALVKAQRQGFTEFLGETQVTLGRHQRLLELTSVMILGLAATLMVLIYRGMIAPLRRGLTKSRLIIERQEKLASLGILASGVAHEIRNPLTAIKIRLFSLRKALPAVAKSNHASVIGTEITRLERIIQDFLQFARPSEPRLAKVDVGTVLQDVHELLRPQLENRGIELRLEAQDPIWIHADIQQMKQVLINLIQNSAENIGRAGTVVLSTQRTTADLNGRTRPAAIVQVKDTGSGIPPKVEARLFDPFFTTKEKGTGLGLSIAARIVEKHGGLLRYETKVNEGTVFELVLPAMDQDSPKAQHDAAEYSSNRG